MRFVSIFVSFMQNCAAPAHALSCGRRGETTATDVGCMLRGGVGLAFHTPRLLQNGDVVYALSKDRHLISTTLGERSDWIPRSYGPALPEKRNSFLRLLKNKGFKEERMTKVGLYAIGTSTTLESNKSLNRGQTCPLSGVIEAKISKSP